MATNVLEWSGLLLLKDLPAKVLALSRGNSGYQLESPKAASGVYGTFAKIT